MSLTVPGTPSSRAEAMLTARFGNTVPVAVLLRGPAASVELQGPRLVAALRSVKGVQVLSPWDRSVTARSLRPYPGAAFVLVTYLRPESTAMTVVPSTEALVARTVRAPVHSYLTGIAVVGRAIQSATMSDTERAELIAVPILVLVLLLVFRSPVAAAVPLAMGGATVMAGHGLLWLASFLTPVNSLGVAIAAMMSLALGVDYALLMVSRVRQEVAGGHDHDAAVEIACARAGRTIAAAGGTLALTMLAASAVATPGLLGPVAIGVVISGILSVALALTAMPALLRLLGPRLDLWEIRLSRAATGRPPTGARALAERLIAHPAVTVPVILAVMLAMAAPAGALQMGPPDAAELPASSPARIAVAMVERTIGPGWSAPFVIIASAKRGAITTPQRLRAMIGWQEQVAREPDVAAVLGPASVTGAQRKLAEAQATIASGPRQLQDAQKATTSLRSGLGRATHGVAQLRNGLASAATGAGSLGHAGTGAERGAQELTAQTNIAAAGAASLSKASARARTGSVKLTREAGRAHAGSARLARESTHATGGSQQLAAGAAQSAGGSAALSSGIDESAAGADHLAASDAPLTAGAAQLAGTIDTIDETVHVLIGPIEILAGQLHSWAALLSSMQSSDAQVLARLHQASQQLGAISTAGSDPGYPALAQNIATITQSIEARDSSQLQVIGQQLLVDLEHLAPLPAQLTHLISALDQLRSGRRQARNRYQRIPGGRCRARIRAAPAIGRRAHPHHRPAKPQHGRRPARRRTGEAQRR